MSPPRLDGKVAVITGGVSGFGKGIATKFHLEGAQVIITDISEDLGRETAAAIKCHFLKADVTSRDDWRAVLKYAIDKFGKLDIVVNNAGTCYFNKPTEDVTDVEFEVTFRVNVLSMESASIPCALHSEVAALSAHFMRKENTKENLAAFSAVVPLGRSALTSDVANACTYFASDEACFITGVDFLVDGGRCI